MTLGLDGVVELGKRSRIADAIVAACGAGVCRDGTGADRLVLADALAVTEGLLLAVAFTLADAVLLDVAPCTRLAFASAPVLDDVLLLAGAGVLAGTFVFGEVFLLAFCGLAAVGALAETFTFAEMFLLAAAFSLTIAPALDDEFLLADLSALAETFSLADAFSPAVAFAFALASFPAANVSATSRTAGTANAMTTNIKIPPTAAPAISGKSRIDFFFVLRRFRFVVVLLPVVEMFRAVFFAADFFPVNVSVFFVAIIFPNMFN